jgi:segregation and condensation protein B
MQNLENKIEAIMLFKNEPVSFIELSKSLEVSIEEIKNAIDSLQEFYKDRGIVIISTGDKASFGTNKNTSELIDKMQKEEFSRDLGRAGLETLSIILYKAPVSRREIDYIRGVNSGFIVRNLLIRGLIEKSEGEIGERSFSYKPTLELFRYLGIKNKEELPEFKTAFQKLEAFANTEGKGEDTQINS